MAAAGIPFTVHQVWVQGGRETMPEHVRRMTAWTEAATLQHGGAYRLWSEGDLLPLLLRDFPARLAAVYRSAPSHAARSDILRLLVLGLHGGIYLDTDVLVLRPGELRWLVADRVARAAGAEAAALAAPPQLVLPFLWDDRDDHLAGVSMQSSLNVNNCFMAAPAGSPLVARLLQEAAAAEPFDPERPGGPGSTDWTLDAAGPRMIQRVVFGEAELQRAVRLLPRQIMLQDELVGAEQVTAAPEDGSALLESLRERHPTAVVMHGQDRSWFAPGRLRLSGVFKSVQHFARGSASLLLAAAVLLAAVAAAALVGWRRAEKSRPRGGRGR